MARKRVAILISGRGSNMAALIEAAKDPRLSGRDRARPLQRPDGAGLDARAAAGIATRGGRPPAVRQGPRGIRARAAGRLLEARTIEIVCLAGFMRLLTPWFVRQWHGRMINIHPALLPAFKGLDTHARALAAGAKTARRDGAFVVPEMDSGPIIAQGAVPVLAGDTEAALAARVLEVEHRIYPQALALRRRRTRRNRRRRLPDRRQTRRRPRHRNRQNKTPGRSRGLRETTP